MEPTHPTLVADAHLPPGAVRKAHYSRAALANACRLYIGFKQATAKLKSPIQKRRGRIARQG